MTPIATVPEPSLRSNPTASWLKGYYAGRALFSVLWIALALTLGKAQPETGTLLLVAYPLWDCLANAIDAARNGGLRANPTQALNIALSAIVAVAVAATVGQNLALTLGVFGVWAGLSGLLQLATGIRRWRSAGAQWPQVLSGAQSCIAAVFMILKATGPSAAISAADIVPYVAFGAFYFAVSATVLAFKR